MPRPRLDYYITSNNYYILYNDVFVGDIEDNVLNAAIVNVVISFRQILLRHCSRVEVFAVIV